MLEGLTGLRDVLDAVERLRASADRGDRSQVARAERALAGDPSRLAFDPGGAARLTVGDRVYEAGRFEVPTLADLRARAAARAPAGEPARLRLFALLGTHPLTDVGGLQAIAPPGTLFQVASQFNCLEAPRPCLVPVADYFHDFTQGPRASIGAFPGALLRHYAAPAPDGSRFEQTAARQLDLLGDALPPDVAQVKHGYLTSEAVADPAALAAALEANFDLIRVGLHDDVEVVLGHDWDGAVEPGQRVAQAFTSTYAAGYSRRGAMGAHLDAICASLLRAAYLGTLLGAVALGKRFVVLTAIGGGVFGNAHTVIWDAICRAADEAAPLLGGPLDVVFNGRDFTVPRDRLGADAVARGGLLVELDRGLVMPLPERRR
ncbi:MAG: hypothetical protein M9894_34540 [Planctomycetes bacterium]|nr:hypothetical protein [Planctomycetota bacterium]